MTLQNTDLGVVAGRGGRVGDLLAVTLSGLCLVHCLALPLVASLLPLAGASMQTGAQAEWVHWLFALIAAPLSAWTLTRPHPQGLPRLAIGLAGVGAGLLFAGAAGFPSHELETPITVTGGLLLASAHILNARRRVHRHPH